MLATQRTNLIARGQALITGFYATTISIGAVTDIPAARRIATGGVVSELAGLLQTFDVSFMVARTELLDLTIVPERTIVIEAGKSYRVEKVRDEMGNPSLVIECKAV